MKYTDVPLEYRSGLRRARELNPALADRYVEHTTRGDPVADAAVASVARYDEARIERLLRAGTEQDSAGLRDAPGALREFFEVVTLAPEWLHPPSLRRGCPTLRKERDALVLGLLAGSLVRAASTSISRSHFLKGRFQHDAARRLEYLIRQVFLATLPGGLEPGQKGWKYAVRSRFVHAQVRQILQESGLWNELCYGAPLSSAHQSFMACNFSAMLLRDLERLGTKPTPGERADYMHIWRYAAHLLGVPEALCFGNEEEANEIGRVAMVCEPYPGAISATIANAMMLVVPAVLGIPSPRERKALSRHCYRASRALIGDELADRLKFPRLHTTGFLSYVRARRRLTVLLKERVGWTPKTRSTQLEGVGQPAGDNTRRRGRVGRPSDSGSGSSDSDPESSRRSGQTGAS